MMQRVAAVALIGSAGIASAGVVNYDEAAIDAIFRQSAFGLNTIDIRFNTALSFVDVSGQLLSIDNGAEFNSGTPSLESLAHQLGVPDFTVSVFFVDAINHCGTATPNIVGCGSSGNTFDGRALVALKSSFAAGSNGAALFAHELGHTLGLPHVLPEDTSRLMHFRITGATLLTSAEVTTILASPLVQLDGTQRYISVTPIAIMAAVPEPHTWAMMGLGLLGMATWVRRRRAWAG